MTNPAQGSSHEVFARYLERREAGQRVELEELCAAHPELAERLRALEQDHRLVEAVVRPEARRKPTATDVAQGVELYRDRLRRMVEVRLDPRLRSRIDASDVVQETLVEAVQRYPEYCQQSDRMPLLGWLRFLTAQKLVQLRRRHLGAGARDAGREVALDAELAGEGSVVLAEAIAASGLQSPSRIASRAELIEILTRVLEELESKERDVILMRHFEQLSNVEVAEVLGLSEPAASLRYMKAAQRLVRILKRAVGGSISLSGL